MFLFRGMFAVARNMKAGALLVSRAVYGRARRSRRLQFPFAYGMFKGLFPVFFYYRKQKWNPVVCDFRGAEQASKRAKGWIQPFGT